MKRSQHLMGLGLLGLMLTLTACPQTDIVVPDTLQGDSVNLPLKFEDNLEGRRVLRFESYTVNIADASEVDVMVPDSGEVSDQSYGFKMRKKGGVEIQGVCSAQHKLRQETVGKLGLKLEEIDQSLVCDLGGPAPGQFYLGSQRDQHFSGALTFGEQRLQVYSNHRLKEALFDSPTPVGFTMTRDGNVIAVLQTVNGPKLTVASRLPDDVWDMISLVTTILMLEQDSKTKP